MVFTGQKPLFYLSIPLLLKNRKGFSAFQRRFCCFAGISDYFPNVKTHGCELPISYLHNPCIPTAKAVR
jgi:hypothetical protein